MKKIFLVIPTLQQGGAERVASELVNRFSTYPGYQVHLVLLADKPLFFEVDDKVHIHQLGVKKTNCFVNLARHGLQLLKLRHLIQKHNPNAVLSFMTRYNIFTLLASSFIDVKVFVSDRSNPNKLLSNRISFLRNVLYPYASGVIAQTDLAKSVLLEKTKHNNIKVIPNPARHVQIYSNISREKIILNAGRLVPEKGHDYLLKAFAKLKKSDWKLVILGDGPLRPGLQKLSKELGIEKNICMPGAVKNIDEWYAKASIFAFSSISEGFPNALVEAMSAGLPCISFDCDAGPRDIIVDNQNGLLIPVGDVVQFTAKLQLLIDDKCLRDRLARKASLVTKKYDASSVTKEYLDFIMGFE